MEGLIPQHSTPLQDTRMNPPAQKHRKTLQEHLLKLPCALRFERVWDDTDSLFWENIFETDYLILQNQ